MRTTEDKQQETVVLLKAMVKTISANSAATDHDDDLSYTDQILLLTRTLARWIHN